MYWLLASPSRGVLWFEPVVLLTFVAASIAVVRRRASWYVPCGLAGFLAVLAFYGTWILWWGGDCIGPRYMTDSLPFWALTLSSLGSGYGGAPFRTAMVSSLAFGALVNVTGTMGSPIHWSARPPVDWFSDRLTTFGDSQLVSGLLSVLPGENRLRLGVQAEQRGDLNGAGNFWMVEWRERPWHRFAAFRAADLFLRTDRWNEVLRLSDEMVREWPDSYYARHLRLRHPRIHKLSRAKTENMALTAYASRNLSHARNVCDGRFGTSWSSVEHQKRGDWLEMIPAPGVLVRGVILFSAPDFAASPSGIQIFGRTLGGAEILLARQNEVIASKKGWIAVRFPPGRFEAVRIRVVRDEPRPWTVSEARFLVAEDEEKAAHGQS